jgi:hypothetical protein
MTKERIEALKKAVRRLTLARNALEAAAALLRNAGALSAAEDLEAGPTEAVWSEIEMQSRIVKSWQASLDKEPTDAAG